MTVDACVEVQFICHAEHVSVTRSAENDANFLALANRR